MTFKPGGKHIELCQFQHRGPPVFTRNFKLILITNVILSTAMPMLVLLGALAGAALSPVAYAATIPPSVQILAAVLAAAPMSLYMGRVGRKKGFVLAAVLLAAGGLLGVFAMILQHFILLCIAHFVMGAAFVGINFLRFAAAEVVPRRWTSNAISYTLASGLIAAFIGPEVFSATKDMLPSGAYAGAYAAIAVLGSFGIFPILALRGLPPVPKGRAVAGRAYALFLRPKIAIAVAGAAVSQAVMALLMTPTALAMVGCGFAEDQAADVIKWHVIAMFAPGFFTGALIQRFGVMVIISAGMVALAAAAMFAVAGLALWQFYLSLILTGFGWSFGYIGSTSLLQSTLTPAERPLVQGANDTLIALASSVASLVSGVLYFSIGWAALAASVLPLVVLTLLFLAWHSRPSACL